MNAFSTCKGMLTRQAFTAIKTNQYPSSEQLSQDLDIVLLYTKVPIDFRTQSDQIKSG